MGIFTSSVTDWQETEIQREANLEFTRTLNSKLEQVLLSRKSLWIPQTQEPIESVDASSRILWHADQSAKLPTSSTRRIRSASEEKPVDIQSGTEDFRFLRRVLL